MDRSGSPRKPANKNYGRAGYDESYPVSVSSFVWALLHVRTEIRLNWYGFSFQCEMTSNSPVFDDSLFPLCSRICTMRNLLSDIRVHSPSAISSFLVCLLLLLLTHWDKQETKNTVNCGYEKRRRNFRQFICAVYSQAYWQTERGPATLPTEHETSEIISLVTKR